MIRVLLADDEAAAREALVVILDAEEGIRVIATTADGRDALYQARSLAPDVVVMDLRMPVLDGMAATAELRSGDGPRPGVLALTTFATDDLALEALRAGAGGFCAKADPPEELARAIRIVAAGDAVVSPAVLRGLLARLVVPFSEPPVPCSGRELEVLAVVCEGATNAEIAERLHICDATVRTHLLHLREKFGARSRAELVVKGWERGLNRRCRPTSLPTTPQGRTHWSTLPQQRTG